MQQPNFDRFLEVYQGALADAVLLHRDEYSYDITAVAEVVGRMKAAIERGTYNHQGRAFKATCKALGIKHTRKAIEDFVR